ncbi:hypothetical protein GDO81_012203 [Engystomops pustulosus]|uniref:Uncharacterized protein n=1 Tax=Engystomops pustulosus TaxID=76066 RepID=A0AAV7BK39_ENGPU|nr:hypothetical protein GDO81_012203 [Engystomops pustulosus]
MDKSGGGSSNSSSRSSSRATSAGSSPSSGARALLTAPARANQPAAPGKLDVSQPSRGARDPQQKQVIEGVLSKYTNLIQGWQNR